MKKQLFLVLLSLLLLGSCGEEEPSPKKQTPNNDKPGFIPPSPGNNPPDLDEPSQQPEIPKIQLCRTNLLNAVWVCRKGETTYKYFLNHDSDSLPTDEPGTPRQRKRLCELHEAFDNKSSENTEMIAYAHWERDTCVNELNEEIEKKQKQDFKCDKEKEEFDDEKESRPC